MENGGSGSEGKRGLIAERLLLAVSLVFTAGLLYYYYTGRGGPILLASIMVPLAVAISMLRLYTEGGPVARAPKPVNSAIVAVFFAGAIVVPAYIVSEFRELNTVRFGSYNSLDVAVGLAAFAMVMAATFAKYRAIFLLNIVLLIYTINGSWAPYPFDHPGIRLERIVTAVSIEFETGVFEKLAQLALTLIGAFMLFISVAQAFGAVESIVRLVIHFFGRRASLIPQAAVVGSMVIAMVSGSGAANAASTGSITIPLMKKAGLRPVTSAAVETAASIGGQLMPPIMGISAFVMAEYLGVSYFDVIARGWAPALVYYISVATAVFLITRTMLPGGRGNAGLDTSPRQGDLFKAASLAASIALLIFLMGVRREYPAFAALQSSMLLLALLGAHEAKSAGSARRALEALAGRLVATVRIFVSFVTDITILLSALGIMTGLMTITGVPTRVGFLLLELGAGSQILLVGLAFAFGYIVGLGLPPVVTYILTVVVIGPYMLEAGFNPWAIHFYAFLLGVMSELSPPTSVTAAVTSRIAGAGFMETMLESLKLALPLFIVMATVLLEPSIVEEAGLSQLPALIKATASSILIVAGVNGRFHPAARTVLAASGVLILALA